MEGKSHLSHNRSNVFSHVADAWRGRGTAGTSTRLSNEGCSVWPARWLGGCSTGTWHVASESRTSGECETCTRQVGDLASAFCQRAELRKRWPEEVEPTRSRFCCPAGVRRGRGTAGESMRRRNDGRSMRRAKWLGGCCTGTEQIF